MSTTIGIVIDLAVFIFILWKINQNLPDDWK